MVTENASIEPWLARIAAPGWRHLSEKFILRWSNVSSPSVSSVTYNSSSYSYSLYSSKLISHFWWLQVWLVSFMLVYSRLTGLCLCYKHCRQHWGLMWTSSWSGSCVWFILETLLCLEFVLANCFCRFAISVEMVASTSIQFSYRMYVYGVSCFDFTYWSVWCRFSYLNQN